MPVSRRHLILAGGACCGRSARADRPEAQAVPLRFALNRGPYDASNAPFLLAERRGYFRDEGLDVEFSLSRDARDALQRVTRNDFDVGFVDLSVLMLAALTRPQELPLGVFVVFDRSPACFVTWRSRGVAGPRDLPGKTLAVVEGDGAFQLFPAFLRAAGVEPDRVQLRRVALADREALMLRREVDGAVGFDSTIAFKLIDGGATLDEIDIGYYAEGGLDLYSNAVIVSRRMLQEQPTRVTGAVRACARGWRDAVRTPQAVLDTLAQVLPGFDRAREARRLDWILRRQVVTPKVRREGLGGADRARLERTARQLLDPGRQSMFAVDRIYSGTYLPALADRGIG